MTKQEQLSTAKELITYINKEKIDVDSLQKLKTLWLEINGTTANTGCSSCINHYLTQIQGWFIRESKPVENKEQIETPSTVKKVKGCSSCKKKNK